MQTKFIEEIELRRPWQESDRCRITSFFAGINGALVRLIKISTAVWCAAFTSSVEAMADGSQPKVLKRAAYATGLRWQATDPARLRDN